MRRIVPDTTNRAADRARVVPEGWRVPGHGRGLLKPFKAGNGGRPPNTSSRFSETLALARANSPAAMQCLISHLTDADGRIAVMAASLILERAFGKPKEQVPQEERAQIDLTKLTNEELQILVGLVDSGRLTSVPAPGPGEEAPVIEATSE